MKPGNATPMGAMPIGTIVHNVELKIGKGGAMARSAGNYAQIVGRDQGYVIVRLNSGEQRLISGLCYRYGGRGFEPRPHEHQRSARPVARAGSAVVRITAASR